MFLSSKFDEPIDLRYKDFELPIEVGQSFHISPFSDLHFGSSASERKIAFKIMRKRQKLENSFFVFNGDALSCILPKDLKRFTLSGLEMPWLERYHQRREELDEDDDEYTIDDMLGAQIDYEADQFTEFTENMLLWNLGNHELEVEKRHAINPAREIVKRLRRRGSKVQYGGYSGMLRMKLKTKGTSLDKPYFNLLYNHGNWGGESSKGLPGATRWANCHEGWDVMIFGHNHKAVCDGPLPRVYVNRAGNVKTRYVWIVGCNTFQRTLMKKSTTYAERAGYPLGTVGVPLIRVSVGKRQLEIDVTTNNEALYV